MKKIIITGGNGFIGCNLVKKALKKGFNVVNIDALTYASNKLNNIEFSNYQNYTFFQEDILNEEKIYKIVSSEKPDYIMHLAAETHVDNSISSPLKFIETNIKGTYNLLEASRKYLKEYNPNNFIFHHISTDEVFGALGKKGFFTEESPYSPRSPYSASKAASDHLVNAWHYTYNLPTLITNCSNNYGPFQHSEKLIPLVITNILMKKEIPVYGDGTNVRDWLHVHDHVDALFEVLEKGTIGESYNIGSENEIKNIELVHKICEIMQNLNNVTQDCKQLIKFVEDRPGHDERYAICPKKINNQIKWKSKINFDEGLKNTINWYVNNEEWWFTQS
tara:strand:- start:1260 stop:2261 length:1002 start_codon:yes stop_codon:yes gene_type:complete